MAQLQSLEAFDCEGDLSSVGSRWEKWKRGLEIYLLAAGIDKPALQRATLLHTAGLGLQEIYHNIPGAHVEEKENINVYKTVIEKLDDYFSPKQSYLYERHLFRLVKQEEGEKFDKFLIRLRNQSTKCDFPDEKNLLDQIVEKCFSAELKKKILLLGDTATIDKVVAEANALETVQRQFDGLQNSKMNVSINKIDTKNNRASVMSSSDCNRCGSKRHAGNSNSCPALTKICLKCGFRGHFQKMCRTSKAKRKAAPPEKTEKLEVKKPKKVTSIDYIFHIDDDAVVNCTVGGVNIEILIDSGSKSNLLTEETWKSLKDSCIEVHNQQASPEKVFMAYGSSEPLTVLGAFDAKTVIGSESTTATFYVIKNGTRNLLGKDTAMTLKVLKIGVSVNTITDKIFPKFKDIQLEIVIDKSVTPVAQPSRRVPIPLEEKINSKLDELVQRDIIEEVNGPSSWVSPIVPILKTNGDVRICVDMRCANKAIQRENHPLPTMSQLVPKFRKSTIFSKLDIKEAFHQVEIKENCRDITTFITSKGLFRYKRLMFGISCAPEHFQKILERILLPCEGVVNFIDDIVVFGRNQVEHDARLKHVMAILKENNVLLNTNKCIFNAKQVEFLGHVLSAEGVRPLSKYIEGIETFREPTTVDEVQSFLGLVNYIGKWLPNLATLTDPIRETLRHKLSKHADITEFWKDEQQSAFNKLKESLGNIKALGFYDPNDKTQVIADASPVGIGTVLVQIDNNGPRIIAYGNKSLTDTEKRYCQTEKEALALVWAIEHFSIYLYGLKTFDLITDHKPLEVIFGTRSKPCPRIERWVLRLQSYNYNVIYRPGKQNIADPFSRLCPIKDSIDTSVDDESHVNKIVQYARPIAVSLHEIKNAAQIDTEFQLVKKGLKFNDWHSDVNNYKLFETELWLHDDDILLRGNKLVIPSSLRTKVLQAAHEGHPGIVAMKSRLRTKVWWPRIDKDAEMTVKNCRGCTLVSGPNPPTPMKRREIPTQAWVDVAIDFLGPLPSGDHLFVIMDFFSRYKEIKILRTITTETTVNALKEIFSRLGIPVSLTADNGRQFTSEEFKAFAAELGIRLYHTIPYWPQMNGEVERQNRDILKRLKISQTQKSNWKDDLLYYLMMYNSTPHSTTGQSPSQLFFNRQFRDKIPSVTDIDNSMADSEVKDKDALMKNKGKLKEDRKRRARDDTIDIGEKVYIKNMIKENKLTTNFNPTPHTVTRTNGSDINVKNDETGQEYRRNIVHLKKMEGKWQVCNPKETKNDTESDDSESD